MVGMPDVHRSSDGVVDGVAVDKEGFRKERQQRLAEAVLDDVGKAAAQAGCARRRGRRVPSARGATEARGGEIGRREDEGEGAWHE